MDIVKIKEKLKNKLPEERFMHCLGTEEKSRILANKFGADEHKAAIAGLLHDCAKYMSKEETYKFIMDKNIPVSLEIMNSPSTLHAFAGEYIAFHEYGIKDPEILKAIRNHTLGDIDMSILDKITFVADKIEGYTRHAPHFQAIRNHLEITNSLDEAILMSYSQTIQALAKKNKYISPGTIKNWNFMLQTTGKIFNYESPVEIITAQSISKNVN